MVYGYQENNKAWHTSESTLSDQAAVSLEKQETELALKLAELQQIAVILQHEVQNSKTKIYIASFQTTLELGYLKGGYVNFGFAVLDFLLQDYCNLG